MEEQSEVAHLVRQLVAQHRDAGGEPGRQADGEGRTNCDTVGLRRELSYFICQSQARGFIVQLELVVSLSI